MSTGPPARLASEDVIVSAPLSYTGSAQRIMRLKRGADTPAQLRTMTVVAVVLIVLAWVFITGWYLTWGLLLVPYRLIRRNARKRRRDELRHRELLGALQSSTEAVGPAPSPPPPSERVGDAERALAAEDLREHMLAGRLTADEFEERLGLAQRARTYAEVDEALADLPPVAHDDGRG